MYWHAAFYAAWQVAMFWFGLKVKSRYLIKWKSVGAQGTHVCSANELEAPSPSSR